MTNTVKVRIPYVVTETGSWCAYGYPGHDERVDRELLLEVAFQDGPIGLHRSGYIEVDLPLPFRNVVQGKVIPE